MTAAVKTKPEVPVAMPTPAATPEVVAPGPKLHMPEVNVENVVSQMTGAMETLESQREYHQGKIDDIDKALEDIRSKFGVSVAPQKKARNPSVGRGTGTRSGNQYTITEAVKEVLRRNPRPLSRPEITSKILEELGYKTASSSSDFANSVYTGGINKLVKDGEVEVVGQRPNTKYRLKK